ncbi:MAG TPA: hypothetical protein VKG38_00470 [Solirubrobacteraceae bacterium]|nr:hypothetical protein [Solirubrobacteraceae bacterium]
MLDRQITLATIAVCAACAAAPAGALGAVAHGAAWTKTPTITAKPGSAMVNTDVALRGRGFPKRTAVRLRECGRPSWLDPRVPCNQENEVSVTTGAMGRFTTTFKVEVCPEGEPLEVITQRICYIGVPRFGEDTGTLEPYVQVMVSYP